MTEGAPIRGRFSRVHRLRRDSDFQRVYGLRHRRESGPLLVYAAPGELPHPRLGLSVGRRVGGAVIRNRVKRRLRASFRRIRLELSEPFDYVVVVRPHKTTPEVDYEKHLRKAMERVSASWQEREPSS